MLLMIAFKARMALKNAGIFRAAKKPSKICQSSTQSFSRSTNSSAYALTLLLHFSWWSSAFLLRSGLYIDLP